MNDPRFRATLAVDLDGVLHGYSRGWHDGTLYDPPVPGSVEALVDLASRFALFVHTSRDPETAAAWLVRHYPLSFVVDKTDRAGEIMRIGFDRDHNGQVIANVIQNVEPARFWNSDTHVLVTDRKLPATAYIDDRAIRFTTWRQTMIAVDNLARPGGPARPPVTRGGG